MRQTQPEYLEPPNELKHTVLPTSEQSVSDSSSGLGSINAVYQHGISFVDQVGAMGGMMAMMGFFGGILSGTMIYVLIIDLFIKQRDHSHDGVLLINMLVLIFGFLICILMIRADSIGHRYQPVLFNRALGKVHIFVSDPPAWWQLWRWRAKSHIETYDWSCVRGELVEIMQVGGAAVPRKDFALTCAIVEAPDSIVVDARFGIGLSYPWAPEPILQLWEHIRRFMMENGPHVVAGDSIYLDKSATNFWGSLWFLQPLIGQGCKDFWTGAPFGGRWYISIPVGLAPLPLLPFTMVGGIIRWLSYQAKREPQWPADIRASLGKQIDVTAPKSS